MPELMKDGSAYVERIKKTSPDGQILMALDLDRIAPVTTVLKNRGKIPTIVYGNISTHDIKWLRDVAKEPGVYLGFTSDINWLKYALRMHKTLWRINHKPMRILGCPGKDYDEAFKKVTESKELRTVAKFYMETAKKVVEPTQEHVFTSVKHYMTIRGLMRNGDYDGVKISGKLCLDGGLGCIALSRLLDEGFPAACENDQNAALCQFLSLSLFDLSGFMGNPSMDTVNNWLIVSHCTSALKLEGIHKDYRAPFLLRDLHNTGGGACPMVAWPIGRRATIMDVHGPKKFAIGAGQIMANTDDMAQPPSGGCRTSVAFKLDGVKNALNTGRGHHQWCVLADIVRPFLAFCKLAGMSVADLEGNEIAMSSRFGDRDWGDGVAVV